jgi:hypothetical protein
MTGLDPQRLMRALILIVMVLFVAAGTAGARKWRRALRLAAIVGFAIALVLALGELGRWWAGAGP